MAQNPDIKGFALIVGLIITTSMGIQYASASKILLSVSNRQPLSPRLYTNLDAYVYMTAFGNYTFKSNQPYIMGYTFIDKTPLIEYSVFWVNTTETLTPVNPLVTTANDTFYQTTVDLNQSARAVGNLTLTAKFYPDISPKFSVLLTKTEEWNLGDFAINWFICSPYTYLANRTTTIDLASKATLSPLDTDVDRAELGETDSLNNWRLSILSDWSDFGNATIYGGNYTLLTYSGTWLEVVFDANNSEIDPQMVGLTYSGLLNTNLFGGYLLSGVIDTALAFFFDWVIYAGALLLISRVFIGKGGAWPPFFVLVGYAFSVIIVRSVVSAVMISTLPEINFQLVAWPPTLAEATLASDKINATWGPTHVFQVGTYFNLLIEIWLMMLATIAMHAYREMSWSKAATISVIAYFIYFILGLFMGL